MISKVFKPIDAGKFICMKCNLHITIKKTKIKEWWSTNLPILAKWTTIAFVKSTNRKIPYLPMEICVLVWNRHTKLTRLRYNCISIPDINRISGEIFHCSLLKTLDHKVLESIDHVVWIWACLTLHSRVRMVRRNTTKNFLIH